MSEYPIPRVPARVAERFRRSGGPLIIPGRVPILANLGPNGWTKIDSNWALMGGPGTRHPEWQSDGWTLVPNLYWV